jgi:Holliday junction resolvase-like predicted endonuclease
MNTTQMGKIGEDTVLNWYLQNDYTLVAKNFNYYKTEKIGEIDLILSKDRRLFVVEVKARKDQSFAPVLEQITRKKLKCLYNSYQGFIMKYPSYVFWTVQFDVAVIVDDKLKIYPNCYSFDNF